MAVLRRSLLIVVLLIGLGVSESFAFKSHVLIALPRQSLDSYRSVGRSIPSFERQRRATDAVKVSTGGQGPSQSDPNTTAASSKQPSVDSSGNLQVNATTSANNGTTNPVNVNAGAITSNLNPGSTVSSTSLSPTSSASKTSTADSKTSSTSPSDENTSNTLPSDKNTSNISPSDENTSNTSPSNNRPANTSPVSQTNPSQNNPAVIASPNQTSNSGTNGDNQSASGKGANTSSQQPPQSAASPAPSTSVQTSNANLPIGETPGNASAVNSSVPDGKIVANNGSSVNSGPQINSTAASVVSSGSEGNGSSTATLPTDQTIQDGGIGVASTSSSSSTSPIATATPQAVDDSASASKTMKVVGLISAIAGGGLAVIFLSWYILTSKLRSRRHSFGNLPVDFGPQTRAEEPWFPGGFHLANASVSSEHSVSDVMSQRSNSTRSGHDMTHYSNRTSGAYAGFATNRGSTDLAYGGPDAVSVPPKYGLGNP